MQVDDAQQRNLSFFGSSPDDVLRNPTAGVALFETSTYISPPYASNKRQAPIVS